jgi:hypothetical protein
LLRCQRRVSHMKSLEMSRDDVTPLRGPKKIGDLRVRELALVG